MEEYLDVFRDIHTPGTLQPCSNCERKFNVDTLKRHEAICTKLKQRKPFDSSKQRLEGITSVDHKKVPDTTPTKPKKNNWKQKHEDFLNTIRSARGVTAAIKKGEPLPPPPPAAVNPDYVQCPHCSRRFNEHAAQRHIEFCKEQKSRIGKSPSSAAASRVAARTKYKPPALTKRNSAGTASSSAGKTRQIKTNVADEKPNKYEKQPVPLKNTATKPLSANTPTKTVCKQDTISSASNRLNNQVTQAKTNGHTPAQYSNRYKKDNYMKVLDNNNEDPIVKPKEVRYGRRASKQNGSLEDIPDAVENKSKPNDNSRRNITIRDPSPTLFDDFGTTTKSASNRRNPFPAKAQVHRPSTETDGVKRLSKFCYECGTKYPVPHAKYCCECGTKRPYIES